MKQYWTVPEEWPGATAVCIAGGPSLTAEQVQACRDRVDAHGRVRVIAINDAYRLAPWADVLYFCDDKWWTWHHQKLAGWQGRIVRLAGGRHDFGDPRIKVLKNDNSDGKSHGGLAAQRDALRPGRNSGYQAIGLAVHFGAKRILLLGYDMQARIENGVPKTHWFGDHPGGTNPIVYRQMLPQFDTLPKLLAARGVEVVNCTPGSALRCFRTSTIEEALRERQAEAA